MPAQLDPLIIKDFVSSFPVGTSWIKLPCNQIGQSSLGKGIGGVYAFLLPQSYFSSKRSIHLHGPKMTQIQFDFSIPQAHYNNLAVVYFGRSTNLKQRFAAHFREGRA